MAAPAEKPAREPVKVAFSEDDFRHGPAHKTKEIALAPGDKLVVELGSNPTTGFSWGEQAVNRDAGVVKQVEHKRLNAREKRVGAGGQQIWTFEALKAGATTLSFSYGRPWAGGEKGTWTLKLTLKVQ